MKTFTLLYFIICFSGLVSAQTAAIEYVPDNNATRKCEMVVAQEATVCNSYSEERNYRKSANSRSWLNPGSVISPAENRLLNTSSNVHNLYSYQKMYNIYTFSHSRTRSMLFDKLTDESLSLHANPAINRAYINFARQTNTRFPNTYNAPPDKLSHVTRTSIAE